jgi:hypothetical protein
MISLAVLAGLIAILAWADFHKLIPITLRVYYAVKLVLVILATLIASGGIFWALFAAIFSQGIDKATRGVIEHRDPEDLTSWWAKLIIKRFGYQWAHRLVWIELTLPVLINFL